MTRTFKIEVPNIEDVSEQDWKEYIQDAVGGWRGQFSPEDPLFDLNHEDVAVSRFRTVRSAIKDDDDMLAQALRLLTETSVLLKPMEDGGQNHPVCELRERIGRLLKGQLPRPEGRGL